MTRLLPLLAALTCASVAHAQSASVDPLDEQVPVGRAVPVRVTLQPPISQIDSVRIGGSGIATDARPVAVSGGVPVVFSEVDVWVMALDAGALTLTISDGTSDYTTLLIASDASSTAFQLQHVSPPPRSGSLPSDPAGAELDLGVLSQVTTPTITFDLVVPTTPTLLRAYLEVPRGGTTQFVVLPDPLQVGPGRFTLDLAAGATDPFVADGRPYWVHVYAKGSGPADVDVLTYAITNDEPLAGSAAPPGQLTSRDDTVFRDPQPPGSSLRLGAGGYFDFKAAARAGSRVRIGAYVRVDAAYAQSGAPLPQLTVFGDNLAPVRARLADPPVADTWTEVVLEVEPAFSELLTIQVRSRADVGFTWVDDLSVRELRPGFDRFDLQGPSSNLTARRTTDPAQVRSGPTALFLRFPAAQRFTAATRGDGLLLAELWLKPLSGTAPAQLSLSGSWPPLPSAPLDPVEGPDADGWTRYQAVLPSPSQPGLATLLVSVPSGTEVAIDDVRIDELDGFVGIPRPLEGNEIAWRWADAVDPSGYTLRDVLARGTVVAS